MSDYEFSPHGYDSVGLLSQDRLDWRASRLLADRILKQVGVTCGEEGEFTEADWITTDGQTEYCLSAEEPSDGDEAGNYYKLSVIDVHSHVERQYFFNSTRLDIQILGNKENFIWDYSSDHDPEEWQELEDELLEDLLTAPFDEHSVEASIREQTDIEDLIIEAFADAITNENWTMNRFPFIRYTPLEKCKRLFDLTEAEVALISNAVGQKLKKGN